MKLRHLSLLAEIGDDTWIIDSGASHHITTKLTDYTSYQPYPEPEIIQTANVHDSLKIHGEGTVFFNTETTNGQIHTVRLDNVCLNPMDQIDYCPEDNYVSKD
jgi:hypothetical protein